MGMQHNPMSWILGTLFFATGLPLGAVDFAWIEGETPASANITVATEGSGHSDWMSDGKWLKVSFTADEVDKAVSADGVLINYAFETAASGPHEIWNRIGFEFVRSPFAWRIDGGTWNSVKPEELTVDCMELSFWCEIAWLKMGVQDLPAGKHTLDIRLPKVKDAKGKYERILYASDALCISREPFQPYRNWKPGETAPTEQDRQAAANVFSFPRATGAAERVSLPLNGIWEIARDDEGLPADVATPIAQLPAHPVWSAIAVPSDKNKSREDLLLAHRLWYRTRVTVPAEYQGRGFFLVFPYNCLNTTIFVNGHYCGFDKNPMARLQFDISKRLKPGVNEICVGIRDAWYGLTYDDPKDPMTLRKHFGLPEKCFGDSFLHAVYPLNNNSASGILATPELVAAGSSSYAADVFVMSSVSNKQLKAQVTLLNPTDQPVKGELLCEAVNIPSGTVACTLPALPFQLEPGQQQELTVAGAWANPQLWWPDAPHLYNLRTTTQVNGKAVDIQTTRFGFREWSWSGRDFKLNGIPYHAWSDCFRAGNKEEWLDYYHKSHQTALRVWSSQGIWNGMTAEDALNWMDEKGVVVRKTGVFDGEGMGYVLTPALFDNWKDHLVAWVKSYRNHPSVMIWSIENEMTFINIINLNACDKYEPMIQSAADAVAAIDPTRPTMVDGGGAFKANSMPVQGDHYALGKMSSYPELAYTANTKGGGRGRWEWDQKRPRFIGEEAFMAGNHPELAYFGGEEVFAGKAGNLRACGIFLDILTQGYRWEGIGGWTFWVGQGDSDTRYYNSFSARAVFCRQWDWTFASDQKVARCFAAFNDTHGAEPMKFQWELRMDDKKVAGDSRLLQVAPGTKEVFDVILPMPRVKERKECSLSLTLAVDGKEIFRDTKAVSVLPAVRTVKFATLQGLNKSKLYVWDPAGEITAFLAQNDVNFTAVAGLDQVPTSARLLVVGRDALDAAASASSALSAWASNGRAVVVLEQTNPLKYQGIPARMEVDGGTGSVAFAEDLAHPVFRGLRQKDLFTWSPGERVYRNAYAKPETGAKSLVQCHDALSCTAVAEMPIGTGLLLVSQLCIGQTLSNNITAQTLLLNMMDYAAGYKQTFLPVVVVAQDSPQLLKTLTDAALKYTPADDLRKAVAVARPSILVVNASPANLKTLADSLDTVRAFENAGGWIVFNGLTPQGLDDYNKLVGFDHMLRPFTRERVTFPALRNPLTAGLTTRDISLYSSERIFPWQDGTYVASDMFSCVVDLDDVAPFGKSSFGNYDKMVNNFVGADGWKLIINFPAPESGAFAIPIHLPKPQTITEFTWVGNVFYDPTTKISLSFDGKDKVTYDVPPDDQPHVLPVAPARTAQDVTLCLEEWQHVPEKEKGGHATLGIDNIYMKVQRPADFAQKVRPMLNVGGLVSYPLGSGGIVLCNLALKASEDVPENVTKKRTILATLLANLKAPFEGSKTVVAGANLIYTPIDIHTRATAYRNDKGWFGDATRTFAELPIGKHRLAGVQYDIYEMPTSPVQTVLMIGKNGVPGKPPHEIKDIPVNTKADALFFLHTARIDKHMSADEQRKKNKYVMFKYVIHYADGTQAEVPVYSEIDIDNYVQKSVRPLTGAQIAWTRTYPGSEDTAVAYSMQWNNPHPDVTIASIDMVYVDDGRGVPVLLALTAARMNE